MTREIERAREQLRAAARQRYVAGDLHVADLEAELDAIEAGHRDPTYGVPWVDVVAARPARPSIVHRLIALGVLSFSIGLIWMAVLSIGEPHGDDVWDHGVAGVIAGTLTMAPLVIPLAAAIAYGAWFLVRVLLGRAEL
ncbi:MAG: hypothetical protein QOG35_1633 [Solirubrobacteraceae bacterium]|jgi:hypothetical protein|nr:hypothetical protein [Solirubrobacteraceae bacterium]